jgi:hypothetical protein
VQQKLIVITFFCLFFSFSVAAQNYDSSSNFIAIKVNQDLKIDGILNEPEWNLARPLSDFHMNFPADTATASSTTIVRVLYSAKYIYVSAQLRNNKNIPHPFVVSSLKRDFPFAANDAFGIIIDPFIDHSNGYGFYVSPYGVQSEEQIYNGIAVDNTWDIKWYCEVKTNDSGWVAEIAIPLSYIRFSENLPGIGINFVRNDIHQNELSSWFPVPRNFNLYNLSYEGKLFWQEIPGATSNNMDQC